MKPLLLSYAQIQLIIDFAGNPDVFKFSYIEKLQIGKHKVPEALIDKGILLKDSDHYFFSYQGWNIFRFIIANKKDTFGSIRQKIFDNFLFDGKFIEVKANETATNYA